MTGLVVWMLMASLVVLSGFAVKDKMQKLAEEAVDFDGMEVTQAFWSSSK
jgi:hypothetical protein